jgi:hypothetical protein
MVSSVNKCQNRESLSTADPASSSKGFNWNGLSVPPVMAWDGESPQKARNA